MLKRAALFLALAGVVTSAAAKESLGVFSGWGAFRDPSVPRCYAIAEAQPSARDREFQPYADIATWPARRIERQVHFRLSRPMRPSGRITLRVGRKSFRLIGGKSDAWGANPEMDAAIVDAMRRADEMTIYATDTNGRRFSDSYALQGAATAIDAAALACSPRR